MQTTRRLMPCQTHDIARGSFYVNPMPVKDSKGNMKMVDELPVFRASNHMNRTAKGVSSSPHPEAIDYVVSPTYN